MNAVNLIPADRRKANVSVSASPVTLGLIGGLVVVLIAAVLYAFTANDVKSRQSELARVTANAVSWQAVANSYAHFATAAQQRQQQIVDVRQLVSGRFPWSTLLSQIGGVMPSDAALSSFEAQSPSADSTAASGAAATSSPTTGSAVTIAGCAASQSAVAATMVALQRVHGVSSVSLQSSSQGSGSGASSGSNSSTSSSGSSGQGCPFQVTFQMTLVLGASATSSSAAATSATPTAATTPATTATSAATATTTPTGAAQ
jgi:Tfp pilus assembly protein PilN